MLKLRSHITLIALLAVLPLQGQTADSVYQQLSRFVQNIATFNRILPQEKVYLHFDNTAYYIGETIWFKAYVVRADTHRQTDLSGILHVQLITREGTVIDSRKLKIVDGQCNGSFDLKEEYASGYYEVRAYTQYMLNFGNIQWDYEKEAEAFFFNEEYCRRFYQENGTVFSRVFPVYQKPSSPGNWHEKVIRSRQKVTGTLPDSWFKKPEEPIVNFFPEGGNMVEGLTSRVAFEIRDKEGKALVLKGNIVDKRGRVSTAIRSDRHGRGDFYYCPEHGERRRLVLQYQNRTFDYELPEARPSGYIMNIRKHPEKRQREDKLQISVFGSEALCDEELGLVIICRGVPEVFETIRPRRKADGTTECRIDVSTEILPEGVCQVTLFSSDGKIHAERLVFVDHPEQHKANIIINVQRTAYDPFQKVRIELKTEFDDKALPGTNLSVSVSDQAHREKTFTEENILSNLLLSSDLYGCIEDPWYYFSNTTRRSYELDILMLTQGWRRYDFRKMTGQERFVLRFQPERQLTISGRVYPIGGLSLMRKLRLQKGLSVEANLDIDTIAMGGEVSVSGKGDFTFSVPDFSGEGLLLLRIRDVQDSLFLDSIASKNRLLSMVSKIQKRKEMTQSDYFPISSSPSFSEYINLRGGYQPHVRILSYYETHYYDYEREETLAEKMGLTLAQKEYGDEAYSLELKEVGINAKQPLRRLDLSSPAIRLDLLDEINLQLDLGMFHGSISKDNVALNAVMRHGIRGRGRSTDKHKIASGPKFFSSRYEFDDFGETSILDELYYALSTMKDKDGRDRDGMYYEGIRSEDKTYYMYRHIGEIRRRYMVDPSSGEQAEVDVTNFVYPDSVRNVRYKLLEAARRLNIYCDKTDRKTMDISEVRNVYSEMYVTDFEYEDILSPIYKGRKMRYYGYSQPIEFYSPDYSHIDLKDPPKDYRRTLYWNPDLKTDAQGKATIEFYNNSTCRHLTISAEGLSPDGQILVLER